MKTVIYHILIVEDDNNWLSPMKQFLEVFSVKQRLIIKIDTAETTGEAKQLLEKKHYHLISLDQHMPEKKGEEMQVDNGVEIGKLINKNFPGSSFLIFTGRNLPGEITKIALEAGLAKAKVWRKSIDSNPEENEFSAREWANEVCNILKADYLAEYIEKLQKVLPIPLAACLIKLVRLNLTDDFFCQTEKRDKSTETIGLIMRFWELTLNFVCIQSFAVNSHFNQDELMTFPGLPDDQVKYLETFFAGLSEKQQLEIEEWLAFLNGHTGQKGKSADYFLNACYFMSGLKKKLMHNLDSQDWIVDLDRIKQAFFASLDAAAFWSSHPIFYHLSYQQGLNNNQSLYKAYSPYGSEYLWPYKEFRITAAANVNPMHVYMAWKGNISYGFELLNMDPYLRVEANRQSNRLQLNWLCHGNAEKGFFYQNTETDKLAIIE